MQHSDTTLVDQWIDDSITKHSLRIVQFDVAHRNVTNAANVWSKLRLNVNNVVNKAEFKKFQQLGENGKDSWTFQSITGWSAIKFANWAKNIQSVSQLLDLLKAKCFVKLGCSETANDLAVSCLKRNSTNVEAMYMHGMYLFHHGSADKSLEQFHQILLLDPNNAKAQDICKKIKIEAQALAAKEKLLKAKMAEGNKLFSGGSFREAYSLYTEALTIDPLNANINSIVYYHRALANSKLNGDVWDTINDCTAAFKANPNYVKPLLLRGLIHHQLRNFEDAIAEYKLALSLENTAHIQRLLDDVIQLLSDFKSWKLNYHMVLGIAKIANKTEVKKAYLRKAKIHHPDRHANASAEMKRKQEVRYKEVDEAYRMLSNK